MQDFLTLFALFLFVIAVFGLIAYLYEHVLRFVLRCVDRLGELRMYAQLREVNERGKALGIEWEIAGKPGYRYLRQKREGTS